MMSDIKPQIENIKNDIASIKIQGATNVALAVIDGLKIATEAGIKGEDLLKIGHELAQARANEPMARNVIRFITKNLEDQNMIEVLQKYLNFISDSKIKIVEKGSEILANYDVILTHCHSSTSTAILIKTASINNSLKVVSTETRPLYQGRITSSELSEAGVDVTMIVDSAAASFIHNDRYLPVSAVLIGCDELLKDGTTINKVGSYEMALAAFTGSDDYYVAVNLLKLDLTRDTVDPLIEMRNAKEVWSEAPPNLKIINPSFEAVPPRFITGYITEAGVIKADQLVEATLDLYPWMKD